MKKRIFGILILLAVAGAAVAFYMYQKPVASLAGEEAVVKMSSTDFFTAFAQDEQKANTDYTGKIVEITGEVVDIMTNSDQSTTLVLASDDPIFGVKCRIDPTFNKAPLPGSGETTTVKGRCTGMNADVELNECIIIN